MNVLPFGANVCATVLARRGAAAIIGNQSLRHELMQDGERRAIAITAADTLDKVIPPVRENMAACLVIAQWWRA